MKNHNKIILGLDHGNGNIKTAHRVFKNGVKCLDEEPIWEGAFGCLCRDAGRTTGTAF